MYRVYCDASLELSLWFIAKIAGVNVITHVRQKLGETCLKWGVIVQTWTLSGRQFQSIKSSLYTKYTLEIISDTTFLQCSKCTQIQHTLVKTETDQSLVIIMKIHHRYNLPYQKLFKSFLKFYVSEAIQIQSNMIQQVHMLIDLNRNDWSHDHLPTN